LEIELDLLKTTLDKLPKMPKLTTKKEKLLIWQCSPTLRRLSKPRSEKRLELLLIKLEEWLQDSKEVLEEFTTDGNNKLSKTPEDLEEMSIKLNGEPTELKDSTSLH
jgi:hypothetical protein